MSITYAVLFTHPVACQGSRLGTALIARDAIEKLLGPPTHDWRGDADTKVTLAWVFKTPKGIAEIRDYWWNGKNEWSIAAQSISAARFLAKHLRTLGVAASTRFNYERDCKKF